jgi:hypothetical protein
MGHASAAMTTLYTGEIPLEQIRNEFSIKFGNKIDVLETMKTGAAAYRFMEWAMGIEPDSNLEKAWIQSLSGNRAIADIESRTDRLRAK